MDVVKNDFEAAEVLYQNDSVLISRCKDGIFANNQLLKLTAHEKSLFLRLLRESGHNIYVDVLIEESRMWGIQTKETIKVRIRNIRKKLAALDVCDLIQTHNKAYLVEKSHLPSIFNDLVSSEPQLAEERVHIAKKAHFPDKFPVPGTTEARKMMDCLKRGLITVHQILVNYPEISGEHIGKLQKETGWF